MRKDQPKNDCHSFTPTWQTSQLECVCVPTWTENTEISAVHLLRDEQFSSFPRMSRTECLNPLRPTKLVDDGGHYLSSPFPSLHLLSPILLITKRGK